MEVTNEAAEDNGAPEPEPEETSTSPELAVLDSSTRTARLQRQRRQMEIAALGPMSQFLRLQRDIERMMTPLVQLAPVLRAAEQQQVMIARSVLETVAVPQVMISQTLAVPRALASIPQFRAPLLVDQYIRQTAALGRSVAEMIAGPMAEAARMADLWSTYTRPLLPILSAVGPELAKYFEQIGRLARFGSEWVSVGARWALRWAVRAREAVLTGDETVVEEFIVEVLGMARLRDPQRWHERKEAVAAVLLCDDWLPADAREPDPGLRDELRKLVRREGRNHRPVFDTKIGGRTIDSLDRPVTLPGGGVATVVDLAVARSARIDPPVDDDRIGRVLAQLKVEEQAVALAWAEVDGGTWAEAAVAAGVTPEFARRVQRKLKRLGLEQRRRQEALGDRAAAVGW